ncbi:hypothetical protein GCM10010430_70850 [Kitasatospora cystarginea]|uniref:pPIWI-RE three-gene island domain-containing protein n=1 Tax=Kitasatospora cystarginea TaxID=58350 RepID=A0ABP5RVN7_9ACTN
MRKWTAWAKTLKIAPERHASHWDALVFAQVELGLTLWLELGVAEPPDGLWCLLSRDKYARLLKDPLTPEGRRLLAVARHYLWPMRRRRAWRDALKRYWAEPLLNRAFEREPETGLVRRRTPGIEPTRHELFAQTLLKAPAFTAARYRPAPAGDYRVRSGGREIPLHIPDTLPTAKSGLPHSLDGRPDAEPVEPLWRDLRKTARKMQSLRAKAGHADEKWSKRFDDLKIDVFDAVSGTFSPDPKRLTISGLLHIVGMVGAGKSTLRDILAVHLAWHNGTTLIVVGDVTEQTELVRFFNSLGAPAAAVRGDGNRETHLLRLHRRQSAAQPSMLDHAHPGFADLSTACGLEALRQDDDPTPLPYHDAPCRGRLEPVADNSAEDSSPPKPFDCPRWWSCQRHHAARELAHAKIWVATPASLLYSSVPAPMNEISSRYLEQALLRSDLVVVDEADRVQAYLDGEFFPAGVLAGKGLSSWVDRVNRRVSSTVAEDARMALRIPDVTMFVQAVRQMPAIVDLIYLMLREEDHLVGNVDLNYFNNWLLLNDLVTTWEENGSIPDAPDRFRAQIHAWLDAPLGVAAEDIDDDPVEVSENAGMGRDLTALVHALVNLSAEEASGQIVDWHHRYLLDSRKWEEERLGESVVRLAFGLLVTVLQHHLARATTLWPRVQRLLGLDPSENVFGQRPPEDYQPFVPDAPMGNIIGFQYLQDRGTKPHQASAELRFFRAVGTGRVLLRELASLQGADAKPSPNVLLLSGTSWAGTSHRYHVPVPVGGILRAPDDLIRNSEFFLSPQTDPLTGKPIPMSGLPPGPERERALTAMMRALATRGLSGLSPLEHERDHGIKDDLRRRIILLVGSYTDSFLGASALVHAQPELHGKVCYLVPDDAPGDTGQVGPEGTIPLRRGDVSLFAATGAWLLVAPLQAIERGHNILNERGTAAFGSMFVIPRPHPRPDDIHLAVQAINAYADLLFDDPVFQKVLASADRTLDESAVLARRWMRSEWHRLLHRYLAYSRLGDSDRTALSWDLIVCLNQVIGRLVRGNVPARVHFCDQAFAPGTVTGAGVDTARNSLLIGMRDALAPYFTKQEDDQDAAERIADALYGPFYKALSTMLTHYGL